MPIAAASARRAAASRVGLAASSSSASARSTASSSRSRAARSRRRGVLNIFLSAPRMEPNATCSARAGGASQPACVPTANTIAKCCACGAPTTYRRRVARERLRAVAQRREIRRGVAVAAVLLAHDQRQRLAVAVREPRREHAQRAVVDLTRGLCARARRRRRRASGCRSSRRARARSRRPTPSRS